jgi:ethanolamine utilization protein EutQ
MACRRFDKRLMPATSGENSFETAALLFSDMRNLPMPTLISQPTRIQAAGNKPKLIDEYIGRVNSKTAGVSVAHMRSPQGWSEPGQTPEFDEFTIVLRGMVRVTHRSGVMDVRSGQAVVAHRGEWVQYSTPEDGGAEYIAVCLPAFSMETVHRD